MGGWKRAGCRASVVRGEGAICWAPPPGRALRAPGWEPCPPPHHAAAERNGRFESGRDFVCWDIVCWDIVCWDIVCWLPQSETQNLIQDPSVVCVSVCANMTETHTFVNYFTRAHAYIYVFTYACICTFPYKCETISNIDTSIAWQVFVGDNMLLSLFWKLLNEAWRDWHFQKLNS